MKRAVPEKYRFLSGSALKTAAMVMMIIDHTAAVFFQDSAVLLFTVFGYKMTLYNLMRFIGRLSFPLFAFLLAEGFIHTSSRRNYGLRLLLFALISQPAWSLEHTGTLFYGSLNVFFTLFLGFLTLCAVDRLKEKPLSMTLVLLAVAVFSMTIPIDYKIFGVCLITVMYMLASYPPVRALVGCALLPSKWIGALAFIPIAFYNGKRGFIRGKALQYLFYAIYPLHMLLFYLLKYLIIKDY